MKLTAYLPKTTPSTLHSATTHPFLRLAGSGQIPKPLLAQWLSQDRLYAQSYVRFIGHLLTKIRLPQTPSSSTQTQLNTSTSESIQEKILDILLFALNNIRTELKFFEDTAAEYGLDLNTPPITSSNFEGNPSQFTSGPITQSYIDMFMSAGSPGSSLLEGVVVLWSTEICYLRAWRYAASFLEGSQSASGSGEDKDGGALREKFIPNWASREFEEFVDRIGAVLDEYAAGEGVTGEGEGGDLQERCERWWRQVVWLEERFWPEIGSCLTLAPE
ncbi:heme oxygenase-like protein [Aspergillus californicus]